MAVTTWIRPFFKIGPVSSIAYILPTLCLSQVIQSTVLCLCHLDYCYGKSVGRRKQTKLICTDGFPGWFVGCVSLASRPFLEHKRPHEVPLCE